MSIDGEQTDKLVKLLDSAVIMLEGGSEFDLQVKHDRIKKPKQTDRNILIATISKIIETKHESKNLTAKIF